MKTLITGGAGFIGVHLAKQLIFLGHSVVLVDNMSRGVVDAELQSLVEHQNVELHNINLLKVNGLDEFDRDFDIIYHLAAIIGVKHVLNRPYDVLTQNQILLSNMIEFGREQRSLKRFVFASTSEVYAGTLREGHLNIPTHESSMLAVTPMREPRTSYMLSKLYGEAMCLQSGLDVTIIRPHNIYGPRMGMSHVIPEILQKSYTYAENEEVPVFSPGHTRTFCYVLDAVQMIYHLSVANVSKNEVYNVGEAQPEITIFDLVKTIVEIVGRPVNIIAGEDGQGSPARRCPDIAKSVNASGFSPEISLADGIRTTFDWYKKNIFDNKQSIHAV